MRSINAGKIINILKANGFVLSRQKGSHMIWKNPVNNIIVLFRCTVNQNLFQLELFWQLLNNQKFQKKNSNKLIYICKKKN